jgi:hypothetical protein
MLVDQRQKWQRITEWISHDSAEAAAASKGSSSTSHVGSAINRTTAGSTAGQDAYAAGSIAQAQQLRSPGMETIESVAELRYSLDTTLIDPEQHAMAQAAAAAAAAAVLAASPRRGNTVQTVDALGFPLQEQQRQQQQAVLMQQTAPQVQQQQQQQQQAVLMQATAPQLQQQGVEQVHGERSSAVPAAGAQTADAAAPAALAAGSSMDPAAPDVHVLQQMLVQEGQARQQAQQLAMQLQQQVHDLLQQQVNATKLFDYQLQQVRAAAAAEVQAAQQVRMCRHTRYSHVSRHQTCSGPSCTTILTIHTPVCMQNCVQFGLSLAPC